MTLQYQYEPLFSPSGTPVWGFKSKVQSHPGLPRTKAQQWKWPAWGRGSATLIVYELMLLFFGLLPFVAVGDGRYAIHWCCSPVTIQTRLQITLQPTIPHCQSLVALAPRPAWPPPRDPFRKSSQRTKEAVIAQGWKFVNLRIREEQQRNDAQTVAFFRYFSTSFGSECVVVAWEATALHDLHAHTCFNLRIETWRRKR